MNIYSGDANDYKTTGCYAYANAMTNVPTEYGILVVLNGGYYIVQLGLDPIYSTDKIRKYAPDPKEWRAWRTIGSENTP